MLALILPRRHRRRLLLPPGLLALAWLLWLGCVAVPQVRGMRVQHVMEVFFPKLSFSEWERDNPFYLPSKEMDEFRPWQTATITGNIFADYFALRYARAAIRCLGSNPNHNQGVRVVFEKQATYASVIRLLDWCKIYDVPKHWVNFRREPSTFYAITTKYTSQGPLPYWTHAVGEYIEFTAQIPWLDQLRSFFTPNWRNSTLLLLLLVKISAYRLGRGWRAR